jgi:hypothetical protein
MNVDVVVSLGQVNGSRGQAYLTEALAAHMQRSATAGGGAHEETAGRLEDCLLDTLCAMRALDAARAARGKVGEAAQEAGQSMLRLIRQLHELTENAIVS